MRASGIILEVIQKHEPTYRRRLAKEMTFLFEFDADGIELPEHRYLTKGEATKLTGVPWGHILDLESVYGGALLRSSYLFIAEAKVSDALRKYGSDFTLSALIDDIAKERAPALPSI
jgi:hypothetical protein